MANYLFSKFLPQHTNNNGRVLLKALELLFLSAGIISSFVILKGYSCDIIFTTELVSFWNSIKCFLSSPLYVCIIINLMILLIALISSFQQHQDTDFVDDDDDQVIINMIKVEEDDNSMQVHVSSSLQLLPSLQPEDVSQTPSDDTNKVIIKNTIDLFCSKKEESSNESEPELADDYYTMEATWNAITGGEKENPERKTSQLKKYETWNTAREINDTSRSTADDQCLELEEMLLLPVHSNPSSSKELRKSETFNDSVTLTRRSGGFIRRDPSMSLEEFNKQVEAFIKRFNDDMRLQRQESDQRFLDMISRGI